MSQENQKNQLETFKLRLEELKEQGVDIDPEKVTEEIVQAHNRFLDELPKEEKEKKLFELAKEKVISLLDDYQNFYRPKGRKIKIMVEIEKDNAADKYGEKFIYSDDMSVISVIGIGTKGKYEKVLEE